MSQLILEFRAIQPDLIALYLPEAEAIFMLFAGLELGWGLVEWASRSNSGWIGLVTGRLLVLLFFHTVLMEYETLIAPLAVSFGELGLMHPGWTGLDPEEIVVQGWVLAMAVWDAMDTMALWLFPPSMMVRFMAPLVILAVHYLVAIKVTVALLEQYLATAAGVIFMGFSSSRWTWGFAKGLMVYLVEVGIRIMCLTLILSISALFGVRWLVLIHDAPFFSAGYWLYLSTEVVAFGYLAWRLPDKLAKRVSDGFSSSFQNPYRAA